MVVHVEPDRVPLEQVYVGAVLVVVVHVEPDRVPLEQVYVTGL